MRRLVPALLRPTAACSANSPCTSPDQVHWRLFCLLRGTLGVPIHISGTFCGSWGVLAASSQRLSPKAALEAFGAAKQLAVDCPAAGRLPAQGPVAAPQPPNSRDWPRHGLQCPCRSHMASPLAASVAEAKLQVFAGAVCQRGDQVPHFPPNKDPLGPPGGDAKLACPGALVHPKAYLRACVDWICASAACCTGEAADMRVWRVPECAVGSLMCLGCSAPSILADAKFCISSSA